MLPAGFDSSHYNTENNVFLKHHYAEKQYSSSRQRRYRRQLRNFQHYGSHLLEIGSNTGGFLFAAQAMGWRATGIEPVADVANYGVKRHNLDVYIGTLDEYVVQAGGQREAYDVIYCNAVLEHLVDPRGSLNMAFDLLRPGGVFFADTVNIDSYTCQFLGRDWRLLDPRAHLSLFTPQNLDRLLAGAGFHNTRLRSRGFRFNSNRAATGWNLERLAGEFRKAPYSLAARLWLKGDSVTVLAHKPQQTLG